IGLTCPAIENLLLIYMARAGWPARLSCLEACAKASVLPCIAPDLYRCALFSARKCREALCRNSGSPAAADADQTWYKQTCARCSPRYVLRRSSALLRLARGSALS